MSVAELALLPRVSPEMPATRVPAPWARPPPSSSCSHHQSSGDPLAASWLRSVALGCGVGSWKMSLCSLGFTGDSALQGVLDHSGLQPPQARLSPRHPESILRPGAPGRDPLSGWSGLSPGKSEGNGKMHITLCDLVSTWDSLSPTQKKSLNQRYQMGCECKVSGRAAPKRRLHPAPHASGVCSPKAGVGSVARCSFAVLQG